MEHPPVPRTSGPRAAYGRPAARASSLTKAYGEGETSVLALDAVDVSHRAGTVHRRHGPVRLGQVHPDALLCRPGLATSGRSGSGRSALTGLDDDDLTRLRRTRRLHLPGLQPGADPDRYREHHPAARHRRRKADPAGWTRWSTPSGLPIASATGRRALGGQQQRVAVRPGAGRQPEIIFGDEPTGNLDCRAGEEVLGFLRRSRRAFGQTIVMVTHDPGPRLRRPRALPRRRPGRRRHAGARPRSACWIAWALRGRRTKDLRMLGSASDPCWRTSCAWRCPWPRSCSASPSSREPSSSPPRCPRPSTTSSPPEPRTFP